METQMTELTLTIPLVPPGLNHATKHTRTGRHYKTKESISFREAVRLFLRDQFVVGNQFAVGIFVYRGAKQKGDVDGYLKEVLDGLSKAGAFRNAKGKILTDDCVKHITASKDRDIENPRTMVMIKAL